MQEEIVYLQNMESPRDVLIVSKALEKLGLQVKEVEIGAAAFIRDQAIQSDDIVRCLENLGYITLDPADKIFSERMRTCLSDYIDSALQIRPRIKLADYAETYFNKGFTELNQQYRMLTGQSIQDFYKRMRVERAKALLHNSNLALVDIAERLSFGNLKNLRRMFAQVTGHSIDHYGTNTTARIKQNVAA